MRTVLDAFVYLCANIMMLNSLYRLYGIYFDRRKEHLVFGVCWLANSLNNQLIGTPICNALGTSLSLLAPGLPLPGKVFRKAGAGPRPDLSADAL